MNIKKELKKNFKLCEDLKKCEDNCSCNAEAECDICKVIDFTLKKDKLWSWFVMHEAGMWVCVVGVLTEEDEVKEELKKKLKCEEVKVENALGWRKKSLGNEN